MFFSIASTPTLPTQCRWIVFTCHSKLGGRTQEHTAGPLPSLGAARTSAAQGVPRPPRSLKDHRGRTGGRVDRDWSLTSTSLMRGLVHATPARHTPAPSPQQSQQDNWAYNPSLRPLREVEGCFRTTPEPCDTVLGGSGATRHAGGGTGKAAPGREHLASRCCSSTSIPNL